DGQIFHSSKGCWRIKIRPSLLRPSGLLRWLPDMDLNHDKQIQSLLCYRYTIGQTSAPKVKSLPSESRTHPCRRRRKEAVISWMPGNDGLASNVLKNSCCRFLAREQTKDPSPRPSSLRRGKGDPYTARFNALTLLTF